MQELHFEFINKYIKNIFDLNFIIFLIDSYIYRIQDMKVV